MTFFDDNNGLSGIPQSPDPIAPPAPSPQTSPPFAEVPPGDPFTYGAQHPQPYYFAPPRPFDLQIPWSWGHLICFLVFSVASLIFVQVCFTAYYITVKALPAHFTQKELQHLASSKPFFAVGSMVIVYVFIFFFLYVTLTFLYRAPFWQSLGWRKLDRENRKAPAKPWIYFVSGCGLSLLVVLMTAFTKTPENTPIQELLKNTNTALAFMAMAVLVAPLVEETLFRGYLYPVIVRIVSAVAQFFGMESARSLRTGVFSSILLTGLAFGMLHAGQLGGSWKLVSPLIFVGIVLTTVRAIAGTTFASFLVHLGYNSTIAFLGSLGLLVAKYGKVPPPHP